MDLSMEYFLAQVTSNPLLLIAVLLTLGVILVNGWTDAPNAIATCVVTRCMPVRAAILMAAVFNFLGVFLMSILNATVAETITKMVDFGTNSHEAIVALSAALFAIVVWAVLAWYFGIPTSESHALIAGLTGGAIALHGGLEGVNGSEWIKVIYGLVISVVMGFALGFFICKCVVLIFRNVERQKTEGFFRGAQIFGAACMSFMHGAQDGQKFMGVILLCLLLVNGSSPGTEIAVQMPIWLMLLCSVQGFSADIAASLSLLFSSVFGIPVSTTHAKTTAIMGVGAVKRLSAINFGVVKDMGLTWILTFPGCGFIGFLMTKLFMWLF